MSHRQSAQLVNLAHNQRPLNDFVSCLRNFTMPILTRSRLQAIVAGLVVAYLGLFALRTFIGHEPVLGTANIILLSFAAGSLLLLIVLRLLGQRH